MGQMVKSEKQKLHLERLNENQKEENNRNWKGGKMKHQGYNMILKPTHPRAKSNHGYVYEHILKIEEKLGRYLEVDEVVHHINEKRDDNRIENLKVMKKGEHQSHHSKITISKQKRDKGSGRLIRSEKSVTI